MTRLRSQEEETSLISHAAAVGLHSPRRCARLSRHTRLKDRALTVTECSAPWEKEIRNSVTSVPWYLELFS